MKAITYYEMKLQSLLPEYLLPKFSTELTVHQKSLYVILLRDIYSCLTYQPNLDSKLAIKLVRDMYQTRYKQPSNLHFYSRLLSEKLLAELS